MKNLLKLALVAVIGLSCAGCIDATTLLTVKKDGSGTIEETVYLSKVVEEMLQEMSAAMGGKGKAEPARTKINETELKAKAAKMGEGVRFVSAKEEKKPDGSKGTRVTYAFSDVRKLKLQSDPDTSTVGGDSRGEQGRSGGSKKQKPPAPLTFGFSKGDAATLTIRFPEPKPGEAKPAAKPRPNMPEASAQEKAMMKKMFDGFRVRMLVKVDGQITQTNASHTDKGQGVVTLVDMDIGRLIQDPKALETLMTRGEDIDDIETARARLRDIPGLKFETEREVRVSFK